MRAVTLLGLFVATHLLGVLVAYALFWVGMSEIVKYPTPAGWLAGGVFMMYAVKLPIKKPNRDRKFFSD